MLRLRGAPKAATSGAGSSGAAGGDEEEEFEALDMSQMSGLGEHVVYDVDTPVTIPAMESALVQIA